MSFLEKNRKALEEKGLAGSDFEIPSSFQIFESKGFLQLTENGHLIDSNDPEYWDAQFVLLQKVNPFPRIVVFMGFGLGTSLVQFLNSPYSKQSDHILIIEKKWSDVSVALSHFDLTQVLESDRVTLICDEDPENIFAKFLQWMRSPDRVFKLKSLWWIEHPRYKNDLSPWKDIVTDEWKAASHQIIRHFGGKEDSLLGLQISIENLNLIRDTPGIDKLKNLFKGIPAVVVSTGPSLNRSLEKLKKIQNRCIILSADASLSILLENGILPIFCATLERDLYCKKFFEKASSIFKTNKTNLVSYPFVPQEGLLAYNGPLWMAYRDYGYFLYFEEWMKKGMIRSSSSVAHFCVNLAQHLGCSEIVLVGQDLSYDPESFSSHADGVVYSEWAQKSNFEKMKERVRQEGLGDVFFVPGNIQEEVPTHSTYFSFMKEFSWEASKSMIPITNSTEGGAKIPLIPWKPLEEVSFGWQERFDPFATLEGLHKEVGQPKTSVFTELKLFFNELQLKLNELNGLLMDQKLIDAFPVSRHSELIYSIRAAHQELLKDQRFVCFVVQNAGREMVECEQRFYELEFQNQMQFQAMVGALRQWNLLAVDLVNRVSAMLDDALPSAKSADGKDS